MSRPLAGAAIAMAVAGMFATNAFADDPTPPAAMATVKCAGINSCKGQGACASATNACASLNACKGQGWVGTATDKECTDQGGTVLVTPPMPEPPPAPAPAEPAKGKDKGKGK